jgi:purine-binding chemotaxis protein CheW
MTEQVGISDVTLELATVELDSQHFGIAVRHVHDVLGPQKITRVPLAPAAVAGSLNLRGRVVTVLDLRTALGLERSPDPDRAMNVVIAQGGELYALLVDQVGDVITVPRAVIEAPPQTLSHAWRTMSDGIVKLDNRLLLMLMPDRLLAATVGSGHVGVHA